MRARLTYKKHLTSEQGLSAEEKLKRLWDAVENKDTDAMCMLLAAGSGVQRRKQLPTIRSSGSFVGDNRWCMDCGVSAYLYNCMLLCVCICVHT